MDIPKNRWLITFLIFLPAVLFSSYIWYISFTEDHTESANRQKNVNQKIDSYTVMNVEIEIDPNDFQTMLDTATEEKYTKANITINGERFENVGIRPKGNSTLSQIASDDTTDRYSFKIKFDEYVDQQNYQGMSKIVLNNNMSDTTYMKEFMSYELMEYSGVPTPMHAFSNISINGEAWGLYLFVEPIEQSFIERNYQTTEGNLYKPESEGMKQTSNNKGGMALVYEGDDVELYSGITSSAVLKQTTEADYKKVVDFIKEMDTHENLSSVMNIDEFLRYFAVNTFVVNLDHYAGNMLHNYYLYENKGIFEILPWDYNLAFGTFGSSATSAINFPIDKPTTAELASRPLINSWLQNDTYKETYHTYLANLAKYVQSGQFEKIVKEMDEKISDYVKNDPTAFYTYEEYTDGLENLLLFAEDRAKSIVAQLNGAQPSDQTGTLETDLNISALGSNHMGGKGKEDGFRPPNQNGDAKQFGNQMPDGEAPENMQPPTNNENRENLQFPPPNAMSENAEPTQENKKEMMRPNDQGRANHQWIGEVIFGATLTLVLFMVALLLKFYRRKKYM